jgi:DNA-binding transcriptional LysR family regulator
MLETHELNIFVNVAETMSFTEAAKRLHISQPAVSMQMSNLENRLDTVLFDRSGRNITLTEAAEVLLPLARDMLNLSTQIEETMASLQGELVGHLRIACSTTAGRYTLPHLIARFRQQYPGVRVTVGVCSSESAVDQVCDGRSQIGILSREAACKEVEYRSFFEDHVVLVVPASHPWTERESIMPRDLIGQPFILREELAGTRRVMQAGLLEHDIRLNDLDVVMELGSAEAIATAIEAGIGVAFMSRIVVRRCIRAGYLAEVSVEGLCLKRQLYMIRSSRRAQTRTQTAFWDFCHAPENKALLETVVQAA